MENLMQNLPQTEIGLIRALQDVETPAPPTDLLGRLQARPARNRRWLWAVPATAVSALTTFLVVSFSLPPSLSLAQVAKAFDHHTQYTITNTRILGNGTKIKLVTYRDGSRWRFQDSFGLPDRTVTIVSPPSGAKLVLVDDRHEPRANEFRVERLLRPGAKGNYERNVLWNGRRVDRFTVNATYRDSGRTQTLDQVLIADPKTKLPIQMTIMRDSAKWGDVWDYQFGPPPESVFNVEIPASAAVYDHREQRRKLPSQLVNGQVGGMIVDENRQIWILTTANVSPWAQVQVKLEGTPLTLKGRMSKTIELGAKPHLGEQAVLASLGISGREWHVAMVQLHAEKPQLEPLWNQKLASGSLTMGDMNVTFKSVPVIRTGSGYSLLSPLLQGK
jgi:hypothetical protein